MLQSDIFWQSWFPCFLPDTMEIWESEGFWKKPLSSKHSRLFSEQSGVGWQKPRNILKESVSLIAYGAAPHSAKSVFCIIDDMITSQTKTSSKSRLLVPILDATVGIIHPSALMDTFVKKVFQIYPFIEIFPLILYLFWLPTDNSWLSTTPLSTNYTISRWKCHPFPFMF